MNYSEILQPHGAQAFNALSVKERHQFFDGIIEQLGETEARERITAMHDSWEWLSRPDQAIPIGDWITWLAIAGRGWGKTRVGAESVIEYARRGQHKRIGLIGPTAADTHKVMVKGDSGILSVSKPDFMPKYVQHESLTWPNGVIAELHSAERPDRLRGPQYHLLWCDELAAWTRMQETWDMAMMGLRLGDDTRAIVTTTPRPLKLIKALVKDPDTHVTHGTTYDNMDNLSGNFKKTLLSKYEGTRLGKQELHAKILEDVPGALWNVKMLDDLRVSDAPELIRIVVAVDPPVTSGPDADECGIVVAGLGRDGHGYVLFDGTVKGESPEGWAKAAISAYSKFACDRLVAEINQGGEMVESTIRQVDKSVSYKGVWAKKGKVLRAEPVSALYEQGRVHHVGPLHSKGDTDIESQMCEFTPDFDKKTMGYSPDRVDALVYALTELMIKPMSEPRVRRL